MNPINIAHEKIAAVTEKSELFTTTIADEYREASRLRITFRLFRFSSLSNIIVIEERKRNIGRFTPIFSPQNEKLYTRRSNKSKIAALLRMFILK